VWAEVPTIRAGNPLVLMLVRCWRRPRRRRLPCGLAVVPRASLGGEVADQGPRGRRPDP
jgi:hypothetical protein